MPRCLLPVLLLTSAACAAASAPASAPAAGGAPWARHAIDNSSRGADGVRLRDVNADGRPDIVTGWEEGGCIRLYLHPGTGRVRAAWPAVTVGKVGDPEDAVFADLDADGHADVVSSCEGNTRGIFVHFAPPDRARYLDPAAWQTAPLPAAAGRRWMFALPLALSGGAGPDLVAGGKDQNAALGWFEAPPAKRRDLAAWRFHKLRDVGWLMSLVAHDMDGDGDADLVLSDRRGPRRGVFWLESPARAPGGPAPANAALREPWKEHPIGAIGEEAMFLTLADVDRDGRIDVVAAVKPRTLLYLRRTGPDAWQTHPIALPPQAGGAKGIGAGDIDGDGRTDLVFSCEGAGGGKSGVMWLRYREGPTDRDWESHDISGTQGVKYDLVELLDLDGDGDLDVLTCEERDNLGVIWYENPRNPRKN